MTNQYVISTADSLLDDLREMVDITGIYGPQSVDLMIYYVRELTGLKWAGPTQHARDLMIAPGLRIWFDAVEPDKLEYGDIVVLHGFDTSDFGTTGVMYGDSPELVYVFTQTPMKPSVQTFRRESVVGGLRYKYAGPVSPVNRLAEPYELDEAVPMSCSIHSDCIAGTPREERKLNIWTPASDEPSPLRDALLKDTPAEKRATLGDFMVKDDEGLTDGEECVKALNDWLERRGLARGDLWRFTPNTVEVKSVDYNLDEIAHVGDVILWDSDAVSQYGHVAIVQNAPAPWWRRVTNWLGITRPELITVRQEMPKNG
ncbi:hypothetical protein FDH47_gp61 [Arthrobacter phage Brent]|uniref:Uncharacterized protein n=1 Tax=Arthrobacter phage Brent TaxID=1701798 RepID=A0A0M4S4C8_9CAUD|nr:hypothetical protein FDH47_gp61 [Arthrobacter phage Brent]ALF01272.1 hypothetical protein SEA_BRENT_61 [Arthrobacter phage Brent]